jgi:hypothetical protein
MTDYTIRYDPVFAGTGPLPKALIGGIMLAGLAQPLDNPQYPSSLLRPQSFKLQQTPQTFGQFSNVFTGEYELYNFDFERAVSLFYSKLQASQESLGDDFEKVLHENLWELYVRD